MNTDKRLHVGSRYLCNFISGVPFDSEEDLGKNLRDVHAVVPEGSASQLHTVCKIKFWGSEDGVQETHKMSHSCGTVVLTSFIVIINITIIFLSFEFFSVFAQA